MNFALYPPAPTNVDYSKLEPGKAFKRQVGSVVFSILLFFIVYVLLILLSIGLAFLCIWGCIAIISFSPGTLTFLLGLGMLGLGIAVFVFLVKFIFATTRVDNSMKVEVTKETQPELFEFIKKLTEETKTPFPKKIFISADVNACVFYNSSFWSMFLPVRKNLEIGLGLVNSVNLSEFKGVMAHEFGHFSQRSMKLGSFTYNVNQVIYNMLYNNNSYNNFLSSWGNISGYFSIFAMITAGIANGIRSILAEMYKFINKNYMALSREMEFHADTVAASVAGGNNLITALRRIEMSAACYNTTLEHANLWLKEKKYTANLFSHQLNVFKSVASENNLPVKNGWPEITAQFLGSFSRTRINFKDQWASHPRLAERCEHLTALNMNVDPIDESAWSIFKDAQALQMELTSMVYGNSKIADDLTEREQEYFDHWFEKHRSENLLPKEYNGFYNGRIISLKDWDITALKKELPAKDFETIFTDGNSKLQETIAYNKTDLETVNTIRLGETGLKSFDFDGEKIPVDDSVKVIETLEKQIKLAEEEQLLLQKAAFTFFQHQRPLDTRLEEAYRKLAASEIRQTEFTNLANTILKKLRPFFEGPCNIDYINSTLKDFKSSEEKKLKEMISDFIKEKYISFSSCDNILDKSIAFKNRSYVYFHGESFIDAELSDLNDMIFGIDNALSDYRWEEYKSLLKLQLEYYRPIAN